MMRLDLLWREVLMSMKCILIIFGSTKYECTSVFAKATLAYFPKSDRNQGVDYTSTEMDIHFGRIKGQDEKAVIKAIDYNKQADEGLNTIYEEDARKLYRKWDNVKHISEALKEKGRPRKVYQSGLWG